MPDVPGQILLVQPVYGQQQHVLDLAAMMVTGHVTADGGRRRGGQCRTGQQGRSPGRGSGRSQIPDSHESSRKHMVSRLRLMTPGYRKQTAAQ